MSVIKKNKAIQLFIGLVLIGVLAIGFSLAGNQNQSELKSYELYLDGKKLDSSWVGTMNNTTYLSASILKELGYKADWGISTATITKGNDKYSLTSTSNLVDRNGEKLSLHTKVINGVHVPSGARTYLQGEEYMIPVESFTQLFNIPVTQKGNNIEGVIHVGKVVEPKPETPTNPSTTIKENPKYPFPEGISPQPITDTWKDDKQHNLKAIADGLGSIAKYRGDGDTLINVQERFYNHVGAITIFSHDVNNMIPHDATIWINDWPTKHDEDDLNNLIPYALEEILKFYLGEKDGVWAFNIIEQYAENGEVGKNLNKQIKLGNRYIEIKNNRVLIGKPNKKYDKYWTQEVK